MSRSVLVGGRRTGLTVAARVLEQILRSTPPAPLLHFSAPRRPVMQRASKVLAHRSASARKRRRRTFDVMSGRERRVVFRRHAPAVAGRPLASVDGFNAAFLDVMVSASLDRLRDSADLLHPARCSLRKPPGQRPTQCRECGREHCGGPL